MAEDRPNALLVQWIKEKYEWANEKSLKSASVYRKAWKALEACPIEFRHPAQLEQLRGWGPKLCGEMTKKLQEHCDANGIPMPSKVPLKKAVRDAINGGDGGDDEDAAPSPAKKPRAKKPYVPAYRSGAYAILLVLATLDEDADTGMTKADLIDAAQPHCDSSFTAPTDATKFYTAWASMKTLQTKELVYERGRPTRRYALTDEGWEVAKRVKEVAQLREEGGDAALAAAASRGISAREQSVPDSGPSPTSAGRRGQGRTLRSCVPPDEDEDDDLLIVDGPTSRPAPKPQRNDNERELPDFSDVVPGSQHEVDTAIPSFNSIRLEPGTFEVYLVLDNREVRTKKDRDYIQEQLLQLGVKHMVRTLAVGDVNWVAKCHDPAFLPSRGCEGDELVLDYVLERKRLDDLIMSLKDGRFHEQKFRLRKSGIQNVIYAVEEITISDSHKSNFGESILSASASIQVVNGYFLKQTKSLDETIRYIARMTKLLKELYENRTLSVIPTPVLTGGNYLPLLKHLRETKAGDSWHITYPAFASLASKSEMMTLRDVFLKMLMCIKGVTGEKAIEIQKKWKTPYNFVKAFEACGDGEQGKKRKREMVAKELSYLVARKKIDSATTRRIAEVWGDAE
jgi:crossover junction endonuclease MUS81